MNGSHTGISLFSGMRLFYIAVKPHPFHETCLPGFLFSHLPDLNNFSCVQCSLHQLINLLREFLLRTADHFEIGLRYRMLGNKNSTAVLKRLYGCLKSIDLSGNADDLLFVKADHRTVYRQCADFICGSKAL